MNKLVIKWADAGVGANIEGYLEDMIGMHDSGEFDNGGFDHQSVSMFVVEKSIVVATRNGWSDENIKIYLTRFILERLSDLHECNRQAVLDGMAVDGV